MKEIEDLVIRAIEQYLKVLAHSGTINQNNLYNVLVLSFLNEILDSDCSEFITEDDYKSIIDAIYCLIDNSCIIQFPKFEVFDNIVHKDIRPLISRIIEDGTKFRCTENQQIRVKA